MEDARGSDNRGIAGGVSAVIYELMKKGIDAGIRTINGTIQQYIFPALIIIAVVTVVVVNTVYTG